MRRSRAEQQSVSGRMRCSARSSVRGPSASAGADESATVAASVSSSPPEPLLENLPSDASCVRLLSSSVEAIAWCLDDDLSDENDSRHARELPDTTKNPI